MIETRFTRALGPVAPRPALRVHFDSQPGRIDFQATFGASRHACPVCGALAQRAHDRMARSQWHLDFSEHAYLHTKIPRVACWDYGKVTQILVP